MTNSPAVEESAKRHLRFVESQVSNKRFKVEDDGSHTHNLQPAKRKESILDKFRALLRGSGRGRKDRGDTLEQPQFLTRASSWGTDRAKQEGSDLADENKAVLNTTSAFVEKYGKPRETIGHGAFGTVRISHKRDPDNPEHELLYAVKGFHRRPQETLKRYQRRVTSEFSISSSLHHPNINRAIDLTQNEEGDYCEVMEYQPGGDLHTLIYSAGQIDIAEADCFFKQLVRGVVYIHEMGVAHCDLKPENLVLTTRGNLKITDFGNAECFRWGEETEIHMTAGICGSAPYIAPEEYSGAEYDPRAVDVWACGIIYMAMHTGRHLWRCARQDEDEQYKEYVKGRREEAGYAPIEMLPTVSLFPCSYRASTTY